MSITDEGAIARWLPNGIVFESAITFEQWMTEWSKAEATDRAINWWIGDILAFGENNFENWSQVIDPDFAEKHRQKLWLSKAIPLEERRAGFSHSFHRELGRLDRAERDRWFDKANAEGWKTVERLREERKAAERIANRPADEPPLPMFAVPSPESEADYGRNSVPEPVAPALAEGERADTIRQLILDVREKGPAEAEKRRMGVFDPKNELNTRIRALLGYGGVFEPIFSMANAWSMRPEGWKVTVLERDDGQWEVRLRADGRKMAIALSTNLPCALVEAALAAELSAG